MTPDIKEDLSVGFKVHVQWDTAVASLHWIVHFHYGGICVFVNAALNMDGGKKAHC